jgi:hypothetical protein
MTKVNERFAAHVTNIAFNLTLSKTMVVQLVATASGGDRRWELLRRLGMLPLELGANRALVSRGLAEAPDPEFPGMLILTEAGQHVLKLLEIAGLVEAIARKEKENAK